MFSRRAWQLLSFGFPRVLDDPADLKARSAMLPRRAHYAGAAIENSMLGATHALANPLSAHYDIIHGVAIGIMLPHVIRYNAEVVGSLYGELAFDAGLCDARDANAADLLAEQVRAWVSRAGQSTDLAQCKVSPDLIPRLADEAANQWTGKFQSTPGGFQFLTGVVPMRLSPRSRLALGLVLTCGFLGVLLQTPELAAEDKPEASKAWSSFRNNFELTGIAGSSLPAKLELLWKIPAPFGVSATAAIVKDRVYVGTINGDFLCVKRETGEKIWSYRSIDDPDPKAFAPAFKCSPTVTRDAIYVGDEDGVFHAIDPKTGKRKWKFHTNGEIISSPSLVGEKVIFGSYDNNLYCLDASNGKKLWNFETDGYVHCSPAIAGKFTFITGCDEQLRVINIETRQGRGQSRVGKLSDRLTGAHGRSNLLRYAL